MAHKQNNDSYEITWLIRRLFRAMAQNTNHRLAKFDVTAADRAVLEFLYPDKALAVPEIASRYQVSRQHVQTTANELLVKKLIATKENPHHKRSSLLTLTSKGKSLFARIRKSDDEVLRMAFVGISRGDAETTRKTLQTFLTSFSKENQP
jgi:DNA-binding MarR family transcriptional regulator